MFELTMISLLFLAVSFPVVNAACDLDYLYRLINGTCNNLASHTFGAANTTMPQATCCREESDNW